MLFCHKISGQITLIIILFFGRIPCNKVPYWENLKNFLKEFSEHSNPALLESLDSGNSRRITGRLGYGVPQQTNLGNVAHSNTPRPPGG